ncbi:MAG: mismatch-specific DNA-glycosylase [Planctomycetes bacterium]|nr:mismatch-specific DNA-glycosylase [Planctomycetota bacterium]
MIEYKVGKHLRILFVGINPHPGSYRRGVPFSNNKTFWYLLNRAGLLNEDETVLRTDRGLKEMFDTRFLPKYRLGFINLVDRPTVEVTELKRGEEKPGVERAIQTILTCKPKVACFVGKVTYNKFRGMRDCSYGWQENIGVSRIYVMHFPIRGPADIRIRELEGLKRASRTS